MLRNLIVFYEFIGYQKCIKYHLVHDGRKGINKHLNKHVKSAFKLFYSQINGYNKKHFSGTKTLWVIQNNSLSLEC